jgi:hypothetical protein
MLRQAEDVLSRLQEVDNKIGYRLSRKELETLDQAQTILINLIYRPAA